MSGRARANRTSATAASKARVWVWPRSDALEDAVRSGGGSLARLEAANAIVCTDDDVEGLRQALLPGIEWVQLGSAGIEMWLDAGVMRPDLTWTAAKGVYARPIAEHVVALILSANRCLHERARARRWGTPAGRLLQGSTVGIVGAGGIGTELLTLLAPFGVRTIALTRDGRPLEDADGSVGPLGLEWLLEESDFVVLAAASTPETIGMLSAERIALMRPDAWLINVARGNLVDTAALVVALESGAVGGAALDVTDPEPLPDEHPLWALPNVIVTPHVASTEEMGLPFLARRVEENVRRFERGAPLIGRVNLELGY